MIYGFFLFQTVAEVIILVLGTIGNILVILVIAKRRKMRTVTNYLILNLACADLTVLISNIPFDLIRQFKEKWVFGRVGCKILIPLQTMGTIASILTLVAISLSRYHAIVYPFHRQMKLSHARIVLVAVWIISFASITPYAMACKYNANKTDCEEDFQSIGMSPKTYTLTMFVLQYVIPIIGMTCAYNRIGAELSSQQCRECGTIMDPEYRRDTKKVVKMLSIVVAVFAVLDLPIHIVWIWQDFFNGSDDPHYEYINKFAAIMLYGNSFINPIIYSICHDQFRTGFKNLFGSCLQPCNFLMKILRIRKAEEDRTFNNNDRATLGNSLRDGIALSNGYSRELPKDNDERRMERSDSGCGGRCADRSKQKTALVTFATEIADIEYVSAV